MSEQKRPAMRPGGGRGPMRVNLDKAKDAKGTAYFTDIKFEERKQAKAAQERIKELDIAKQVYVANVHNARRK